MSFASKLRRHTFTLIIIIMILYVGIGFSTDIGKLSRVTLRINYWTIPLILIPMTLHNLILGVRFHIFLKALGINIPIKKSILIYITGLSLAVTPASSGQILKSQIIKKQLGYAISKTSPIILIEQWHELTSVLLILIGCAVINAIFESTLIIIVGIAIASLLFSIMRNNAVFALFKKIMLRFRSLKIFEESIENSQDSLKILTSKKNILYGFMTTTPAKILEAVTVFFAFQILGVNINFVSSTQIFFTALVSGVISFVPGGLVITEASMIALLLKYYSSDVALLTTAVLFVRLVTIWYSTVLGMVTAQFVMKIQRIKGG
jgi:glycosyltransferase 2 family protein